MSAAMWDEVEGSPRLRTRSPPPPRWSPSHPEVMMNYPRHPGCSGQGEGG